MSMESQEPSPHIGSLNEKPLHAALKQRFAGPNDRMEVPVDGFVIDVVQDDLLVEIQTKNFSSIKRKLTKLTVEHKVRLVHPIAQEKWIVKLATGKSGKESRRKSPKRGSVAQLFEELVFIPKLLGHPNFSLMVLLIQEEEVRRYDPNRGWRRKGWITDERRLLDVVDEQLFESPEDMDAFLPPTLPESFTTSDLADATRCTRRLAQQIAYCLRAMSVITPVGKQKQSILYERASSSL